MKKKKYEKPSMKVHELKQRARLLQVSGLDPFTPGGDPLNP